MDNETHECTACSCEYTDDEGGIQGYFGMLPMSFCPTCLSSIYDMMDQLNPREWVGLTDDEVNNVYEELRDSKTLMSPLTLYKAFEAKLKEENGFDE